MNISLFPVSPNHLRDRRTEASLTSSLISRLLELCVAHARVTTAAVIVLCGAAAQYVIGHFAMNTDTYELISAKLPWRIRQTAFDATFPTGGSDLVVVVDGKTPELGKEAADELAASLRTQKGLFRSVQEPDGGPFWAHEGLLFASVDDVKHAMAQLLRAQPFLGSMASDPSLRGVANTISLTLQGVGAGQGSAERLRAPIRSLADALANLNRGKRSFFSWHNIMTDGALDSRLLRHIVLVDPVLDYSRLQPGGLAVQAIRATARRLGLDRAHGVRIRLTGAVPLKDEEFATLTQRAGLIACLASTAIILMLWFAVRSARLIVAILATMLAGLVTTAGIGLAVFHRFNLISVAFIPLFVGMGMDLGIQFSVRYRAERMNGEPLSAALAATGRAMGGALTLAAAAIGVGFLAFLPTAYRGVSQLGTISGIGMFVALALTLTFLPALIALTQAPGLAQTSVSANLIRIDEFILQHRRLVVGAGVAAALISALLLPWLRFDFNPMHLRSRDVESVATLLDLMHDPDRSPNTLEVVRPNLAAADRLAALFRKDPTVHSARTLSSFVPTQQAQKISLISDAANLMDLTLNPLDVSSAPSDSEVIASLENAATKLRQASLEQPAIGADARRLADELDRLAREDPSMRALASHMLIPAFLTTLDQVRELLAPRPIRIDTLPTRILRQWQNPDGRARVSVSPSGDSNSNAVLRQFVTAGLRIAPDATGTAVYIQAYARAVVSAFLEAGVLSFVAISCLLFAALRRSRDVAVTMAPIVLTALLTLSTCVLIEQPLNFANIIALPLLFGMGVAFHIYFVMSARSGSSHLLTSSLARGVFFSALATATGFGSLWASKHPGTATMGKLLMISLVWTLISALIFQPALISLASRRGRAPPAAPCARRSSSEG